MFVPALSNLPLSTTVIASRHLLVPPSFIRLIGYISADAVTQAPNVFGANLVVRALFRRHGGEVGLFVFFTESQRNSGTWLAKPITRLNVNSVQ